MRYLECGEVRQEVGSKEAGKLHEEGEVTLFPSHFSPFLLIPLSLAFTHSHSFPISLLLKLYPNANISFCKDFLGMRIRGFLMTLVYWLFL